MGKKTKKKARNTHKERRVSSGSPRITTGNSIDEMGSVGVLVVKERKPCTHLENGPDLDKISSKIGSLLSEQESISCKDCKEGSLDRKATKGKSKHGKKKGMVSTDTKSELRSIWVCLQCGHFACGGVGFPTTPQSHAVRHARITRHPCVIQLDNPQLRWCFPCDSPIPVEKSQENGEQKDILSDIVKLIKGRSSEGGSSMNAEDVWFGGGNVGNGKNVENNDLQVLDGRVGYKVRGFVNLGNSCFFNSVLQNLLAMDMLRDYFMKLERPVGPLTVTLKKLFSETSLMADSRNATNPKTLFGCICAKAPQFRGYQQQDSHELLRYLLDGLCTEEMGSKKVHNSFGEYKTTSNPIPTSVDAIFGGQLSSTVCCLECGHFSIVYEPFLDLSLPVPTRKPPAKKAPLISRPRKTKLPLRKGGRIRVKGNTDAAPVLPQSPIPSESSESSCLVQSCVAVGEQTKVSLGDLAQLNNVGSDTAFDDCGSVSQNYDALVIRISENKQFHQNVAVQKVTSLDDSTWLDYVEPGTAPDDQDPVSQIYDFPVIQDSEDNQVFQNIDTLQNNSESQSQVFSPYVQPKLELDSSRGNSCEDELPLQAQESEVLLLPYKEENSTTGEMVRKRGEASTSVVGSEQDILDFDGFGDLFNEPEIDSVPNARSLLGEKNCQANEMAETGILATNSSESDPDEVDNTDAPVSIDSCLAYFTKPELLSNEHAWHCESCSKNLQHQWIEAKKNWPRTTLKTWINGGENKSQNAPLGLNEDLGNPFELGNLVNENIGNDLVSTSTADSLVSHTDRLEDSNPNCTLYEISQKESKSEFLNSEANYEANYLEVSQRDKNFGQSNHIQEISPPFGHYKLGRQENFGDQAGDSCSFNECISTNCDVEQVQDGDTYLRARDHESDDNEGEEMDSRNMKVKRDATKRILINRAPTILTIHLKRFSQDARGRLSKLSGHVNFRDTIDLRPYMDPRSKESDICDYRLVGVVEHSGTMRGGHYVAYVRGLKSNGKTEKGGGYTWYHASDAYVREVSLEEVLRCEAYILFYEKI